MWSLYDKGNYQDPLVFSNRKSQQDVVEEVVRAIKEGYRIIFLKGVCGTGKSAIALHLAKELGKASIVVPVKALQNQYMEDYTCKKYLVKKNGEKLKINVITGRANHACPYLQENLHEFETEKERIKKTEENYRLSDFDNNLGRDLKSDDANSKKDATCNNFQLPCKIEIKEKNIRRIKGYLKKNPKIKLDNFSTINHVRRLSIAPVCPYWSPIVPSEINLNILDDAIRKNYLGLKETNYTIYQRKIGCAYYNQFNAYADGEAIIFNSKKYLLETEMNRKPLTDIEIIDECDEFLDSFSNEKKIYLNRLNMALGNLFAEDEKTRKTIDELIELTKSILKNEKISEYILNGDIFPIKDTKILDLLKYFLDSDFMTSVECDEENYCYHCEEVARAFEGFLDETYLSFHKEDEGLIVRLVTINLKKKFKELLDKNKILVMMSGTLHSEEVLKNIFGLDEFRIIEAETKMPGKITRYRTGLEADCSYDNFQRGKVTRRQYLLALSECVNRAKKPLLVHVNSFNDLPLDQEAARYNITNIMTKEKLKQSQEKDRTGEEVRKFKEGKIDILFSTKCNRGIDFPGEKCNSIILTKYPYPDVNSLFWKILRITKPGHYSAFYRDKARRELLQRIYRGLRLPDDHIYLLSPDKRVLNAEIEKAM